MENLLTKDYVVVTITREEVAGVLHDIDPASITEEQMLDISSKLEKAIKEWNSDSWSDNLKIVSSDVISCNENEDEK